MSPLAAGSPRVTSNKDRQGQERTRTGKDENDCINLDFVMFNHGPFHASACNLWWHAWHACIHMKQRSETAAQWSFSIRRSDVTLGSPAQLHDGVCDVQRLLTSDWVAPCAQELEGMPYTPRLLDYGPVYASKSFLVNGALPRVKVKGLSARCQAFYKEFTAHMPMVPICYGCCTSETWNYVRLGLIVVCNVYT